LRNADPQLEKDLLAGVLSQGCFYRRQLGRDGLKGFVMALSAKLGGFLIETKPVQLRGAALELLLDDFNAISQGRNRRVETVHAGLYPRQTLIPRIVFVTHV
jgi:hypothetical protein